MKLAVVVVVLFCFSADARAQEYVNNEFHFAISFPPARGWTPPEVKTAANGGLAAPQRLLLVASKKSGERISVQIVDVGDGVSIEDPEYRQGFREGNIKVFPPSIGVISEDMTTFAGVPSYEMVIGGTIQTLPINIRMVAMVANRLQYSVTGFASDKTRLTDGEVGDILATFRFTEPPAVPVAKRRPPTTAEMVGRLAAYAVMAILATLLIALVVRRRRAA